MLMPMPLTIWFACRLTLSHACSSAIGSTAATAMTRPSSGCPVQSDPIAPAKAPISIIPSRLRLSTPARSLTSSPSALNSIGIARRRLDATNSANRLSVVASISVGAPALEPPRAAREQQDDEPLDDEDDRARHAGDELHRDPARAQEAEQQRAGQHALRGAAGEQADDQAVEPVTRREARLQRELLALQHEAAGQPRERAGDEHREHHRRADRHAGAACGRRIEPDRAQAQAE